MTDRNQLSLDVDVQHGAFHLAIACSLPLAGVTAIYGASGAGKTTLLRCIAGLHASPHGHMHFRQQHWQHLPTHRRGLAYVCQQASLFPHLTVSGNLDYAQRRARRAGHQREEIIALFALAPLLARAPQQLSGGERQRVVLARALLSQPQLLLLDEPFSGIDQAQRTALLPYIRHLSQQLPIIMVSHDLRDIECLAQHIVHLADGRLIAQAPASTLLPSLRAHSDSDRVAALEAENIRLRAALAGQQRLMG
ncbi:molybdate transport system ATP-binding protein [Paraperlucidibaca baekdonensis]|uniref:Molybdate transport system ATP-binding protein n=1 Tax=Paraperlucidibaca baekdonensis TaxID=748120 RepID=A0A3E0H658_9GAMM|nr:ATP-binding cassette domain-containing protein [Paraperlucidibaca baekdonensis]REH38970.1 molybdate transport system ATP-binding protein [Paraperlucidibaca baekdonensis]